MTSLGEVQALTFWRLRWALMAAKQANDEMYADELRMRIQDVGRSTKIPKLRALCEDACRIAIEDDKASNKSPA